MLTTTLDANRKLDWQNMLAPRGRNGTPGTCVRDTADSVAPDQALTRPSRPAAGRAGKRRDEMGTKGPEADSSRFRARRGWPQRSEEHTSELQSRENLVCRLLLEKKKESTRMSAR